ncbi:MAG: hypothetical protein IJF05_06430 [Clostridia bacterium]|nr:hypothetical protein [Clostridia bacterium]
MKKNAESKNAYRELGYGMVKAPSKSNNSPKGEKIVGKGDLRTGKN